MALSKLSIGCSPALEGCVDGFVLPPFLLCCARIVKAQPVTYDGAGN